MNDGYAIATEEKIIFINGGFCILIEISIPYEKIDHFQYMATRNFIYQYKNNARKK